jgi:signal transduction histidine kinase
MIERTDSFALACVAGDSVSAAALQEALGTLFPRATVSRIDPAVERTLPTAVHCAIVDTTVHGEDGVDVLRRLRASGYAGAAVLMREAARAAEEGHSDASRLGARLCPFDASFVGALGEAVADALRVHDDGSEATTSAAAVRALRHNQHLVAAGEIALRLQHSLNNPLAALLAEAQLLELEELPPEHRASVQRIIEQIRRVVQVVRGLDGVGRA